MMLYLRRDRVVGDKSRYSGIAFECALENKAHRGVSILSQEYELWFAKGENDPNLEFVARLSFDLNSASTEKPDLGLNHARAVKLIWHFTPNQLQHIEDVRQGKEPWFQIRNRLTTYQQYVNPDGSLHGAPSFAEESAADSRTNVYPARFKVDHEEWAKLLNDVGFIHIVVWELKIPTFPPGFERTDAHLKEAWEHHRAGRNDSAMMSCYKAFECLGYSVTGQEIQLAGLIAHLMSGQEEEKREKVKALWASLSALFHLGRHDRGAPVVITHADGELALVSATALLKYLAG